MFKLAFVFFLSLSLRLYQLTLRPLHHDESVNGWFVDQMIQRGYFVYDPNNYHGPLYFYFLRVSEFFFGRTEWALRFPSVVFGVLISLAPFLFRRWIGTGAAWIAAIAISISPAEVFFSRYAIHEMGFALFQVLFVYFWMKSFDSLERAQFRRLGLSLGFVFGLLATMKENFVLLGAAVFAADLIVFGFGRIRFWLRITPWMLVSAVPLIVVFFSGFFQHWNGVLDFFKAFLAWTHTGVEGNGHAKPFYYWLKIFTSVEWTVGFGLVGSLYFLFQKNKTLRWISVMGMIHLLAYSVVSYKTPWCALVLMPPFFLLFGAGLNRIFEKVGLAFAGKGNTGDASANSKSNNPKKTALSKNSVLIRYSPVPFLALLGYTTLAQMVVPNYFEVDSDRHPYIYGQTYREFLQPIQEILTRAEEDQSLFDTTRIVVVSRFTWPLPWYLGKFKKTAFYSDKNFNPKADADFYFVDANLRNLVPQVWFKDKQERQFKARQWAAPMLVFSPANFGVRSMASQDITQGASESITKSKEKIMIPPVIRK